MRSRRRSRARRLLVDVHHTAVNRADVLQRRGQYPDPRRGRPGAPPEIPGLEFAGVVAAVGDRVTGWHVGDEVMGIESGGGYAEQLVVHARQALPVPDGLPWPMPRPCPRSSSRRGTRSSCRAA